MKSIRTLVVLANEHDLRLLATDAAGQGLHQIAHHAASEFSDAAVRYSDREGRMRNGPGPISALDRPTSERSQSRGHFADHVLALTEAQWAAGGFDQLIIAAPAAMLGVLRDRLGPDLAAVLLTDLTKDLLHIPLEDMAGHLPDLARP